MQPDISSTCTDLLPAPQICGVTVFAAAVRRLAVNGFDCSDTCSLQTCIDVAAVATSLTDVLLHLLLLVSLHKHWPAGTVTVVVWNALKGAAAVYLLVHFTYQLQTRGAATLVLEHYMGMVALVPAQAVVLYTLAWAAHEQRSANQMDDDDLP